MVKGPNAADAADIPHPANSALLNFLRRGNSKLTDFIECEAFAFKDSFGISSAPGDFSPLPCA